MRAVRGPNTFATPDVVPSERHFTVRAPRNTRKRSPGDRTVPPALLSKLRGATTWLVGIFSPRVMRRNVIPRTLYPAAGEAWLRGAEVVVNGAEALEELRSRPYDVVLTDVEMPEMVELETARRIHREWTAAERPRIIAMTANASKPVRLDALAEALGRCRPRAVLDPGALERLGVTPADGEFVAELVDALLREAPGLLQTLRGADARRAAHTLKSNARVFGATALAELCQELEALAKADHLADTPPSCSVGSTPSTPASSALCRT